MRQIVLGVSTAIAALAIAGSGVAEQTTPLSNTSDLSGLAGDQTGTPAPSPTPTPSEIDKLNAASAYKNAQAQALNAEAALATAKANAAKIDLGPLAATTNGGSGAITAATGAGKIEGTMLASRALVVATDRLADRMCLTASRGSGTDLCAAGQPAGTTKPGPWPSLPAPIGATAASAPLPNDCDNFSTYAVAPSALPVRAIVIEADSQKMGFDGYDLLNLRLNAIGRQFCDADRDATAADGRTAGLKVPAAAGRPAGFLPAVSAGVDLVQKLLATDYTIAGIDIPTDDLLMEKELIRAIEARNLGWPIYAPDLHPIVDLSNNPIILKLAIIDKLAVAAAARARSQADTAKKFQTASTTANLAPDKVAEFSAAFQAHQNAADGLTGAITAYNALLTSAMGSDPTKPNFMTTAIREAQVASIVRSGGWMLIAKMDAMGASTYTKKNFFTAFGAMPFYVSGGVLVSYTLVDGKTGQIIDAFSQPVAGGFRTVSDVHRRGVEVPLDKK